MALDPNLAEAHAARGMALANSNRRAEAAEPSSARSNLIRTVSTQTSRYARFSVTGGDFERGYRTCTRAPWRSSRTIRRPPFLLQMSIAATRPDEESEKYGRLGLKRAEEAASIPPGKLATGAARRLRAGVLGRKRASEMAWMDRALAIDPDDANARYNAACMYAQLGEIGPGLRLCWRTGPGMSDPT